MLYTLPKLIGNHRQFRLGPRWGGYFIATVVPGPRAVIRTEDAIARADHQGFDEL